MRCSISATWAYIVSNRRDLKRPLQYFDGDEKGEDLLLSPLPVEAITSNEKALCGTVIGHTSIEQHLGKT